LSDFAPGPEATDGEASNPGPRARRRGPRSEAARLRRSVRHGGGVCSDHLFFETELTVLSVNIRSLMKNGAELQARLGVLEHLPDILCLTETWLDQSVGSFQIEGFECVGRLDRRGGQKCGGVATYARLKYAQKITLMESSECAERQWFLVHCNQGPILLGNWYRPPHAGEVNSIESCRDELRRLRPQALGSILVGDLNVHQRSWLTFSLRDTPEGGLLFAVAQEEGLAQLVKEPTREGNLLDLVLTDMEACCTVLPKICDHKVVSTKLKFSIPEVVTRPRMMWHFRGADWPALRTDLANTDWSCLSSLDPTFGADTFLGRIKLCAEGRIPRNPKQEVKSTHEWLTADIRRLVDEKAKAEGTPAEAAVAATCSAAIAREYQHYIERVKWELSNLRRGSKAWWKKARKISHHAGTSGGTASLRENGQWIHPPAEKACTFARAFQAKFTVPTLEVNAYSAISTLDAGTPALGNVPVELVQTCLSALRDDCATGPDQLPARILRECAHELAQPLSVLVRQILATGTWPDTWRLHWIIPLYKRKSVFDPGNYRGIHLTTQLSKVVERILNNIAAPFTQTPALFGANQFAYSKKKGARDALAFLTLSWIQALESKSKVAVFCSDVQGAFDKVSEGRIGHKLKASGLPPDFVAVLISWLAARRAHVMVEGSQSQEILLQDMVFQGTVLGPTLWNIFFQDSSKAIKNAEFEDIVFADDLNAYKLFENTTCNDEIVESCTRCQRELHAWGRANGVSFDPAKESMHVLSRTDPFGDSFRILGVLFDCKLTMAQSVNALHREASWRLRTLLRVQRFHTVSELVHLFKSQIWSHIEYRTSAIFHACSTHLARIDSVQRSFLRAVGMTPEYALLEHHMAPPCSRRDMAMLGVIHRTVIGQGPLHFNSFFKLSIGPRRDYTRADRRRHTRHLQDWRTASSTDLLCRSAFGLIAVYNLLPADVVAVDDVKIFQQRLQGLMKRCARNAVDGWENLYSPRLALHSHPLLSVSG
jgi:hypothetical protein